jgi:hypothetical protein
MPVQKLKDYWQIARNPAWLCFVWFGMTAGISLLEGPVKFTAPALSRAAALDVGRVVFAALNKAELVALILLLVLVRGAGLARRLWPPVGVLVVILIAQSAWLLPELAARAAQIVSGIEPRPSIAHATYAVLELVKLVLLLVLGFQSSGAFAASKQIERSD